MSDASVVSVAFFEFIAAIAASVIIYRFLKRNRKPDYSYILASFITVIFPALFLAGGVVPEIAMDVIGGLFLVHCSIEKDWQWCRQRWVQCLGMLWVYMCLRSLLAPDISASFSHSIVFARYFIFAAALGYWTFSVPENRQRFMQVLTVTLAFMIVDGFFEFRVGYDIVGGILESATGRKFPDYEIFINTVGQLRLGGPFRKPILGIMITWLSFPVFLKYLMLDKSGAGQEEGNQRWRAYRRWVIAGLTVVLSMGAVSLSGERLALLLMLLGWGIAVLLLPACRGKVIALFIAGVLTVGITIVANPLVMARQGASTVKAISDWHESPYGRLLVTDWSMVQLNPVFGIGSYEFRLVCPSLYPGMSEAKLKETCYIHPHNVYLEWLIENGVIGLGLFVFFIALVFVQCIKSWKQEKQNPLFIGFLIAFALRVWPIASTTGLSSRWGAPPFWLVLGCLIGCMVIQEKRE